MPLPLPEDRPRLEVTLDDGSQAELSPLLPEDRDVLAEGMSQLSPESRFTRFGLGRGALTRHELDYLTRVDQRHHVAWGAIVEGAAAGVGRYIVEDDGCAEIAVTVVDRFQSRGLGGALFEALVAVARADGIEQLCVEALPENLAVQRIFRGVPLELDPGQGLVIGRVEVADIPVSEREAEMVELLEEVRGDQSPESGSSSNEAELTQ
jgi:GNAT superfamily N-acetyltransferase